MKDLIARREKAVAELESVVKEVVEADGSGGSSMSGVFRKVDEKRKVVVGALLQEVGMLADVETTVNLANCNLQSNVPILLARSKAKRRMSSIPQATKVAPAKKRMESVAEVQRREFLDDDALLVNVADIFGPDDQEEDVQDITIGSLDPDELEIEWEVNSLMRAAKRVYSRYADTIRPFMYMGKCSKLKIVAF